MKTLKGEAIHPIRKPVMSTFMKGEKVMFKRVFALFIALMMSTIALGGDVAFAQDEEPKEEVKKEAVDQEKAEVKEEVKKPEQSHPEPDYVEFREEGGTWFAKIAAFIVALYFFLFGLGEALTRISVYTKNGWDNKAAAILSQILWFMGSFLGKFGYKLPKLVLEDEAKKLEDKKKSE